MRQNSIRPEATFTRIVCTALFVLGYRLGRPVGRVGAQPLLASFVAWF